MIGKLVVAAGIIAAVAGCSHEQPAPVVISPAPVVTSSSVEPPVTPITLPPDTTYPLITVNGRG